MKTIRIVLIILFISACTDYSSCEKQLLVADNLISQNPDSAYSILCGMDKQAAGMTERLRMKHLLLLCNAQLGANVPFSSDSIANVLVRYYAKNGNTDEQMLAYYIKGCAFRDLNDRQMSLYYFNKAVSLADTTGYDCDNLQLGVIYSQIAQIFMSRKLLHKSLNAYNLAKYYALKAQDPLLILNIQENMSKTLIGMGQIKEAIDMNEKTANQYKTIGNISAVAKVLATNIELLTVNDELDSAKVAMKKYEAIPEFFLPNGEPRYECQSYYYVKGAYFLQQDILDSAIYFFRKLQNKCRNKQDQYYVSWGLCRIYKKLGVRDSVTKYSSLDNMPDHAKYREPVTQHHQNLPYAHRQKMGYPKILKPKDARKNLPYWIIGSISIIIIIALLIFQLLRQKRIRQRILLAMKEEGRLLHAQITDCNQKIILLEEQIREKDQLLQKQNEMDSRKDKYLQENEQLQQTIVMLKQKVDDYEKKQDLYDQTHSRSLLLQDSCVERILEMGRNRNEIPSYDDWHTLYSLMEEYYPRLAVYRKDISDVEYQVCILTILECKLMDIGFLTGLNSNNLSVKRTRLLYKIFKTKEGGTTMFDKRMKEL